MKTFTISLNDFEYDVLKKLIDNHTESDLAEKGISVSEYDLMWHAVTEDVVETEEV